MDIIIIKDPLFYFKDNIFDRFLDCKLQKLTLAKQKRHWREPALRIKNKIWEEQIWEKADSKAFMEEPISRNHLYCRPPLLCKTLLPLIILATHNGAPQYSP